MSIKDSAICNTDLLQPSKFILAFPRIQLTQFFCQAVNIPGISVQNTMQNTPFSDLSIPGDKINYDTFTMEFLVDEELQSWIQVHDWIKGISFPTDFQDYKDLKSSTRYSTISEYPQYADADLIIQSAVNQAKIKFHFVDMFPVSVSGVNLDIRVGSERTLTAIATFRYKRFDIIKV
jgi:hypothetical protein